MDGVVYVNSDGRQSGFAGAKRRPLREVLPAYFSLAQIREILWIPAESLERKLLEHPEIPCEQYRNTSYYWLDLQTIKTVIGDPEIEEGVWSMFLSHPIGKFPLEIFDSNKPAELAIYMNSDMAVYITLHRCKQDRDISEKILDLVRENELDLGLTGRGRYYSFLDSLYFIGVIELCAPNDFLKSVKDLGIRVHKMKEGDTLYKILESAKEALNVQNATLLPCNQNLSYEPWTKELVDFFRSK